MKPFRKNILYIYTFGHVSSKYGRSGVGIKYIFLSDLETEISIDLELGGYEAMSQNQLELHAIIEAIAHSRNQNIPVSYDTIEIRTTSRFVTDNFKNAKYRWPKSKWHDQDGKLVLDVELWRRFNREIKGVKKRVELIRVKEDVNKKIVQKLAKNSVNLFLKNPTGQVMMGAHEIANLTQLERIEMRGQKISIRIIKKEYQKFKKTSNYRFEVISKRSRFYKKIDNISSKLHHFEVGKKYVVTFNRDSKNPKIIRLIKEL